MSDTAVTSLISIVVNGLTQHGPPAANHETLLDWLRARGLTGVKEGCAEGECGACAVAMLERHDNDRSCYRSVNSCLMSVNAAAGREFHTVEGLGTRDALCGAQSALAAAGGSQCGYCTPGFVISLFCEHYRPDRTGPCDPLSMAGNLCRCTGYRPIRDAALTLGPPPAGPLLERLAHPAASLDPIHLQAFSRPRTVADCIELLAARPDARPIHGGTDLMVESNLHGRRFDYLVSLEAIDELRTFAENATHVVIGAGLPLTELAHRWTSAPPAFGEWLALFASPPIRHRATLGGNLATASPIGDAAPLLLALDASIQLAGASGTRTVAIDRFFTGYRQTALRPGEIIAAIRIPKPVPDTIRFYKVSKRRLDDISTVAAAFAITTDASDVIRQARFAFGGVAATPTRISAAEKAIAGMHASQVSTVVPPLIARSLEPISDHRGSREYRRAVAASLVEKFAWECHL